MKSKPCLQSLYIDCIPTPTHLFSGIAFGNVASQENQHKISKPKMAALESIEKMRNVIDQGGIQIALPPIPRPDFRFLQSVGILAKRSCSLSKMQSKDWTAFDERLVRQSTSSSAMWTANWAHVHPSYDCKDGKLHISVANMAANTHRFLEVPYITEMLSFIFSNVLRAQVHPALPPSIDFHDEGAANDIRLSDKSRTHAINLFVWGRKTTQHPTKNYPARQTLEACRAIARRHKLDRNSTHFIQQNPKAIDAGVFHSDVIAMGSGSFLVCHENAFVDQAVALDSLRRSFYEKTKEELTIIEIPSSLLSLEESVQSYFFNSQIIRSDEREEYSLLLTNECKKSVYKNKIEKALQLIQKEMPLKSIQYLPLSESMMNGGGPACLRLHCLLEDEQISQLPLSLIVDHPLLDELKSTIDALYPESLSFDDLLSDRDLLSSLIKAEEAIAILLGVHTIWSKTAKAIGLSPFLSSDK